MKTESDLIIERLQKSHLYTREGENKATIFSQAANHIKELVAENEALKCFGDTWICQSCGVLIVKPHGTGPSPTYTAECTFGNSEGRCKCGENRWRPLTVHQFIEAQEAHYRFVNDWNEATGETGR